VNEQPWEFEIGEKCLRGGPGGVRLWSAPPTVSARSAQTSAAAALDQAERAHAARRTAGVPGADPPTIHRHLPLTSTPASRRANKTTKLFAPGWEAEVFTVMRDTREDDPFADVQLRFTPRDPAARTIRIDMGVEAAGFEHVAADHIARLYLDTLRFFGVIG
jgi:hypothetical protein